MRRIRNLSTVGNCELCGCVSNQLDDGLCPECVVICNEYADTDEIPEDSAGWDRLMQAIRSA